MIAGNWKMNLNLKESAALARTLLKETAEEIGRAHV